MRFAHPYLLLLLLLIPLLVWIRFFLMHKQSMQFSSSSVLQGLPRTWRMRLQPVIPTLFALGTACLIIALARPQRGLANSRIHTEAVDIILLVDLSESMNTPDFEVDPSSVKDMKGIVSKLSHSMSLQNIMNGNRISRLDASKDVIDRFLQKRPDDRIGIVAFASLPYAVAPLTLDHGWLQQRMNGLSTHMLDGHHTAIGDGIASAVNRLRDSKAKSKVIILLTDGANNFGTLSPEDAASAAAALGIKIYTIGAGGAATGFSPPQNEVDETTLTKIAKTTGGKFYRARDLKTLEDVYSQIDKLEKTEIEVKSYTRYEETAKDWIIAGIVLLGMEQILGLTKLGRLP